MEEKQQFFTLKNESETKDLAQMLASFFKKTDVVLLHGDLGVGKTTFAKYFIRSFMHDDALDVPSPTFTLVQHYGADNHRLDHYDCYRLEEEDEILEIGLEDSFASALTLIEWPGKIRSFLPEDAFLLGLKIDPQNESRRLGFLKGNQERMAGIVWPETLELS